MDNLILWLSKKDSWCDQVNIENKESVKFYGARKGATQTIPGRSMA
jgi:hypothetical protein